MSENGKSVWLTALERAVLLDLLDFFRSHSTHCFRMSDFQHARFERTNHGIARGALISLEAKEILQRYTLEEDEGFSVQTWELTYAGAELAHGIMEDEACGERAGAMNVEAVTVPASDRVVALDHNSAGLKEAIASLDSLDQEVRRNDVPPAQAEYVGPVRTAIRALNELLRESKVRVAAVAALTLTILAPFATKFSSDVAGQPANAAMEALERLVGF